MTTGKLRNSRLYRAKFNLLSWSGRADWSPPPIARKVLIRIESDGRYRVSLWPSEKGTPDRLFDGRTAAAIFAASLSIEHGAEISHG
ncbi:hypothetical protein SPHFLASMR4Y_00214 [Sphingorhabdus sp. SMR4y]|nr:hypothetical protein SPHFLASMR4Y_00214 [Sphingorhabdus sp. SMR4y]